MVVDLRKIKSFPIIHCHFKEITTMFEDDNFDLIENVEDNPFKLNKYMAEI